MIDSHDFKKIEMLNLAWELTNLLFILILLKIAQSSQKLEFRNKHGAFLKSALFTCY